MDCPHCSALAAEDANFCPDCGMPLVLGGEPEFGGPGSHGQPLGERIGRGAGDAIGYGIRGAAGTALAPARQAWTGPDEAFRRFLRVFSWVFLAGIGATALGLLAILIANA